MFQTSNDFQLVRSTSTPSVRLMEMKKLGPEEANRSALKEFEDCRNLAMHHTQLKAECYNKAKDAIQRNNTSVALYYSQIANLHKNKIDMYNHKAANCIMEVHNLRQNNPGNLLIDRSSSIFRLQSIQSNWAYGFGTTFLIPRNIHRERWDSNSTVVN